MPGPPARARSSCSPRAREDRPLTVHGTGQRSLGQPAVSEPAEPHDDLVGVAVVCLGEAQDVVERDGLVRVQQPGCAPVQSYAGQYHVVDGDLRRPGGDPVAQPGETLAHRGDREHRLLRDPGQFPHVLEDGDDVTECHEGVVGDPAPGAGPVPVDDQVPVFVQHPFRKAVGCGRRVAQFDEPGRDLGGRPVQPQGCRQDMAPEVTVVPGPDPGPGTVDVAADHLPVVVGDRGQLFGEGTRYPSSASREPVAPGSPCRDAAARRTWPSVTGSSGSSQGASAFSSWLTMRRSWSSRGSRGFGTAAFRRRGGAEGEVTRRRRRSGCPRPSRRPSPVRTGPPVRPPVRGRPRPAASWRRSGSGGAGREGAGG
ncbi:hypothetical protein SHIRM173S_12510 [Streptomyces hirsutus]